MIDDLHSAATELTGDVTLCDATLTLKLGTCRLNLRSNSDILIDKLADYFGHVVTRETESPDMAVVAIESEAPELDIEFRDWKREPGKTGRKDTYFDLADGRLVRKVRTGMVFLQSESRRIAAGPCVENDNQVINFINAQYMNWLQQRGWLICHASGLVRDGGALGIAGFSGGGKSTLMLRLLDDERMSYLTNDRLFIRREQGSVNSVGIPKLPRINPGTIVHNPKLHSLIPAAQRQRLLNLPVEELWHLEDKYDVHMERVYGAGRITPQAGLSAFLVLNWTRDGDRPLVLEQVDLNERQELLGAIMKAPGPFYQYSDGRFFEDTTQLDKTPYLETLKNIPIYEASGAVDFDSLARRCMLEIMH